MGLSFQEDFQNYTKEIQPKLSRIIVTFILTCGLLSYGEISYLSGISTLLVIGCGKYSNQSSWSEGYSSPTIDTCFQSSMTYCIVSQYSTPDNSNSSLEFTVPFAGVPSDIGGKALGILIILSYFTLQFTLQMSNQLALMKRKRIQNLIGPSLVYILCDKRTEKKRALCILISLLVYVAFKIGFIYNRQNYYSKIECDGTKYHLEFTLSFSTWIGSIIQSSFIFILMILQYFSQVINYLSDMDLRNQLTHLSKESMNQLSEITILPLKNFENLITNQVNTNYIHLSYFPRLLKRSVFLLPWFSINDDEIIKYILLYKSQNPSAFYPHNITLPNTLKKHSNDSTGDYNRLL